MVEQRPKEGRTYTLEEGILDGEKGSFYYVNGRQVLWVNRDGPVRAYDIENGRWLEEEAISERLKYFDDNYMRG